MRSFLFSIAAVMIGTVNGFACPDAGQLGRERSFTGSDLYNSEDFRVTAGGDFDISQCDEITNNVNDADGYLSARPNYSFNLSEMDFYELDIKAESECDSVILINSASGHWYFDDDGGGDFNPEIRLTRPADGWVDVWVGSLDGERCPATLSLETFDR